MSSSDNGEFSIFQRLNRLGYLIPAVILCVFLLVAMVSTFVAYHSALSKARKQLTQSMVERLTFVQGAAENLLEIGMNNRLQQLISSFAADTDLNFLLIVDRDDRVLAADDLSFIGQSWVKLGIDLDRAALKHIDLYEGLRLGNRDNNGFVDAYASLCVTTAPERLRAIECGFIAYRVNLAPHIQATTQALREQAGFYILGMGLVVLVTLSLLQFLIRRRTERIIAALRSFSRGVRSTRIYIDRNDEIGDLGRSLNSLLDEVVEDEREVRNGHERLNALFDNVLDSVIVIDELGLIQDVNPATETIFGYRSDEMIGQNIDMLMPGPVRSQHDQFLNNYRQTGEKKIIGVGRQVEALHKSGRTFPVELAVTEMHLHGQRLFTGIIRDISEQVAMRQEMELAYDELRKANAQLAKQATTDTLTGLPNRRFFDNACLQEVRRSGRQGTPLTLMMMDVDYFKNYNDYYGHPEGDRCLQTIAEVLSNTIRRSGEVVARYGGEEFAVILPGYPSDAAVMAAQALMQRVWDLALPHAKSQIADRVTISMGLCTYFPGSGKTVTPERLLKEADKMLYEAKGEGRNRYIHSEFTDE